MSTANDEVNPYELLDVNLKSSEADIKRAYRQRSLKVNPNNPDADCKFHELNQAYELLLDPIRRLALDTKLRVIQARAERFKSYDNKRKRPVNEPEEREKAFKNARMEKQKEVSDSAREDDEDDEDNYDDDDVDVPTAYPALRSTANSAQPTTVQSSTPAGPSSVPNDPICDRCRSLCAKYMRHPSKPNPSRCLKCDKDKRRCVFAKPVTNKDKASAGPSLTAGLSTPARSGVSIISRDRKRKRKQDDQSPESVALPSQPAVPPRPRPRPLPATMATPSMAPPPSSAVVQPPPSYTPTIQSADSSSTFDLKYENMLLREQLGASQEELRMATDRLNREREHFGRMKRIFEDQITSLKGTPRSDAGPSHRP